MPARARIWWRRCGIGAVWILFANMQQSGAALEHSYRYYAVGNPGAVTAISDQLQRSAFVLMGGGKDVDEAFRWMIRKAGVRPGTGGKFVILRATGSEGYNAYVYYSGPDRRTTLPPLDGWTGGAALGLSSVQTLVVPDRAAADDPFVNSVVAEADAVFIAGGDQANYIRYWQGTALQQTLNSLLAKKVPVGGTSAGLAILGEFNFAALQGTIKSSRALTNPFDPRITIGSDPLSPSGGLLSAPAFASTITDSHFVHRDRMGRLVTFVARLVASEGGAGCQGGILPASEGSANYARGIGVSEQAALLVQGDGTGEHFTARRVRNPWTKGHAPVYFVRPLEAPSQCMPAKPLTVQRVEIRKLADSGTVFNLSDWTGVDGYIVNVEEGMFDTSPY